MLLSISAIFGYFCRQQKSELVMLHIFSLSFHSFGHYDGRLLTTDYGNVDVDIGEFKTHKWAQFWQMFILNIPDHTL
jgi:hypothetical protein